MFPMLGGEVVEGEQRLAVFAQALDSLLILDAIAFGEAIECSPRQPSWSPPSRCLAGHAWLLFAGPLAACSRHSLFCAPNSVAHASSATPHRPLSRSRAPRRRRRAAVRSSNRAA